MKSVLFKIISAGFDLLNTKSVNNKNNLKGNLVNSYYRFLGKSNIVYGNADLSQCRIRVEGDSNDISLKGKIKNGMFLINGNNNKLILEEGVEISNFILLIRGNNSQILIGKRTSIGGVRIISVGNNNSVEIGEDCMLSDHIEIWNSDTHPIYNENGDLINHDSPIYIGNRVWIGTRVNILKGVRIGDGAVVGLGSTVVKDIIPKSVNVGVPSKQIKENISWNKFY